MFHPRLIVESYNGKVCVVRQLVPDQYESHDDDDDDDDNDYDDYDGGDDGDT